MRFQQAKNQPPDHPPAAVVSTPTEKLHNRLQGLGLRRAVGSAKPAKLTDAEVAERVHGELIAEGLVLKTTRLPITYHHGFFPLHHAHDEPIHLWPQATVKPQQCRFIDTETNGLGTGAGSLAFLVGVAYWQGCEVVVKQWLLTRFGAEKALLDALQDLLSPENLLVSYNGSSFDLPLLISRLKMQHCALDRFSDCQHLDLLHWVRRGFRGQWAACDLQSAERELLGFVRTDDMPGAMAPSIWSDWLRYAQITHLPGLMQHHLHDIVSLVLLPSVLQLAIKQPGKSHISVDRIANHYLQTQRFDTGYRYLQKHEALLCSAGLHRLAWCHRRMGQWPHAVAIWQRLALEQDIDAIEHLAKYHEHRCKDKVQALGYAERLRVLDPQGQQHVARIRRLQPKI